MLEPRYEKLLDVPQPGLNEDIAFLYHDDGNPVREHWLCYCVSGFDRPRRFAIAHMASEDTDFYEYNGPSPERCGLAINSVYRVIGSDRTNGYDQDHVIFCFTDKTIEFTGLSFGISKPVEADNALDALLRHVKAP